MKKPGWITPLRRFEPPTRKNFRVTAPPRWTQPKPKPQPQQQPNEERNRLRCHHPVEVRTASM
jgi:hypothetical protein